jgi:hypothetical protein
MLVLLLLLFAALFAVALVAVLTVGMEFCDCVEVMLFAPDADEAEPLTAGAAAERLL